MVTTTTIPVPCGYPDPPLTLEGGTEGSQAYYSSAIEEEREPLISLLILAPSSVTAAACRGCRGEDGQLLVKGGRMGRRRIGMGEREGGRKGEGERERANGGCFSRPNGGRTGMEREGEAARSFTCSPALFSRAAAMPSPSPPPLPFLSRPPSSVLVGRKRIEVVCLSSPLPPSLLLPPPPQNERLTEEDRPRPNQRTDADDNNAMLGSGVHLGFGTRPG